MGSFDTILKEIRKRVKASTGKTFSAQSFADYLGVNSEKYRKWEQGSFPRDEEDRAIFRKLFQTEDLENIKPERISFVVNTITKENKSNSRQVIPLGKHAPLRLTSDQHSEAFGDWPGLPMYNTPVTASFVATYRDEERYTPQYYLHDPRFRDCDFGAIITGDSMHDEIRHGDFIACKEITDKSFIVYGDIYYVVAKNGLETCKYVNADPDNNENLMLVAKSNKITPSPIKKDMILKLYKVRGIVRGY